MLPAERPQYPPDPDEGASIADKDSADEALSAEEALRAERIEEASDRMRDLMVALDKIAHDANLSRGAWLYEIKDDLEGLADRYADWTDQFNDDFAEEPPYVDPKPWECQPCGYRGATSQSVTPENIHEGHPVYNPRATPPE
ncbi:hypothetical protein [Cryobacterium zhongshanensis]|uniref:Uncharacterized protein n=1 Tax=Cryobacterium zhongshanensis TaxID=2928153 RepID=A0AA41QZC5_9MICO|nr:hypothetical protein [Cryobacterium zhongshanensis]MCI4659658.1 hypothetical protein [Cryobacterium zhongshanensis]